MHNGVVESGVELLAETLYLGHTELFHRDVELIHYHLNAAPISLVLSGLCQCADKIIINRQEFLERFGLDIAVQTVLFLLAALAEVIILGADAQVLVVERVHLGLEVGLLFFFLFLAFFLLGLLLFGLFSFRLLAVGFLGFYFGLLGLDLFLYFIGGRSRLLLFFFLILAHCGHPP